MGMSQWRTTFEGQQPLEKVREALRALEAANPEGLGAVDLAAYARLLRLLRLLETAFERLDPELYHAGIWTNVGSWLTNARNFTGNFASDKNPSHLHQANANVDEVINVVRPLEILGERAVEAVSKAASVYEKKLLDELEATRTRHVQLKAEFDVLASEVTQARARLVANDQVIEQQKARLDQAIADFQKQFSTAESTRASEFATATSRMQTESSSQLKTLGDQWASNAASREKEWAAMVQGATAEVDKQTEYFEGRRAEVDKIFGAIGSASLAGHFAKTANDDSKAANTLRRIALGLMCLMIVVAGLSFLQSFIHPEIDWSRYVPMAELERHPGRWIRTCGLIVAERSHRQMDGRLMKFLTLADRSGMVETELFADAYRRWGAVTAQHPVVTVSGKVEPFANRNGFTLRVDRVEKPRLQPCRAAPAAASALNP
jgi:hypothetical protein